MPEIKIYPNPASHSIIINQGEITDMTYQLIDMNGGIVKAISLPHAHHNVVWDINDVVAGTYVLTMTQGGKLIGSKQQVVVK
ncbi:MAG: T9SS type A sorting domain-containing protein [Saprospiraceae bacterium]|nr:T9SS type A sorting domain-containing protein [Saprospiraceae bacterium]